MFVGTGMSCGRLSVGTAVASDRAVSFTLGTIIPRGRITRLATDGWFRTGKMSLMSGDIYRVVFITRVLSILSIHARQRKLY